MEQHSVDLVFGTAQVLWIRQDGTYHRKSCNQSQRDEFLAEVIGAANYLTALGWPNA